MEPIYTSVDELPEGAERAVVATIKLKHRISNRDIKRIVYRAKPTRPDRKNSKKYKRFFRDRPNPV